MTTWRQNARQKDSQVRNLAARVADLEAENARLRAASAIVEALASADPVTDVDDMGNLLCPLCMAGADRDTEVEHNEGCPWVLARRHANDQEPTS